MPLRRKPDLVLLKALLDERHDRYNQPGFIPEDPISIPHGFSLREDIEVSGFLTATIAWGRRDIIVRNALSLMQRMDHAPSAFVQHASPKELKKLDSFVHRTLNGGDAVALIRVYENDGMEAAFALSDTAEDTSEGILRFRERMMSVRAFPARTGKHLADPSAGSSAKRLNMFLRWMVRTDKRGVDFGLWTRIRPDQLICPLDVHTGNVARRIGLLSRTQNDWKAAVELTSQLRKLDPQDPVRYDFSLFGMGVYEPE
jgi:uncharacterized protein (TIGR02757 family)